MDWKIVVAALLVTTAATPGVLGAPPNDPPEADAGLDQRVTVGTTVLLDATGSRDADGTITDYDWRIETPDGDTTRPDCETCKRTRFRATTEGTYTVTLTVTDDDGATRTDSLYVTAAPDDGPTVELDGPTLTTRSTPVTFQADTTPGSEPITDVAWSIDDSPIPAGNTTTVTRAFEALGARTVTVTVTDAIGRTSSDSRQVTIEDSVTTPPAGDENGTDPGDPGRVIIDPGPGNETEPGDPPSEIDPSPGDGDDGNGTLASTQDPTVTGPQLVTGDEPLDATYGIESTTQPGEVTRIRWTVDGDAVATTPTIDATWTPGRHTLEAEVTYADDSTDTATFEDGATTVVADPAPEPTLGEPTLDRGEITGRFDVDDDYGNLADIAVTVDDITVVDRQYPPTRRRQPATVTDSYRLDGLVPNENYTITLTATDDRGQTRTTTRTVQPEASPEILSIGFRDDTVDSYHPRIQSDRYTATHVVKIQLNGYPAEKVTVETDELTAETIKLDDQRKLYNKKADILTVETEWAGKVPQKHPLSTEIKLSGEAVSTTDSSFVVTPSPPELRLTSPTEGTKELVQNWGMVVNASSSFDPDNHEININWLYGAENLQDREWSAKLSPTELAGVRITDETEASSEELGSFLPYYVPRISNIDEKTDGPYNGSETVTLEVWSAPYAFTKNTKRYNISLGARTNSSDVDIVSMTKRKVPTDSVEGNPAIKHRLHRWVATVRVSASDLNEGVDWVTFYNEENPERIYVSEELGAVDIQFESKKRNLSIERTSYRVRNESGEERIQVTQRERYEQLTREEWKTVGKRQSLDTVSVESLRTESYTVTRSKRFGALSEARQFAAARSDWSYGGKESSKAVETVIVSKWTRNPIDGRPTGQTRRVVSNPNAYVQHREYTYSTTRTVTETRQVTKRVPVTVSVEKTIEETVCRRPIGCYDKTRTVTVEETNTVERSVEVEREVTRRIEHSYWAKRARSPSHTDTGDTRQVRTEPREYHTEYLVNTPEKRTVTKHRHVASKPVQKAREEWTYLTELDSLPEARALASAEDRRIGSVKKDTEWVLAKSMNTTDVVRTYDQEESVLKTYATVSGTLIYGPQPDQRTSFSINIEMEGLVTNEEILDAAEDYQFDCDSNTEDCDA